MRLHACLLLGIGCRSALPTPLGPASTSATITASEGGTLELEGATLDIPAGVLEADTEVRLERVRCGGALQGDLFAGCVWRVDGDAGLNGRYQVSLPTDADASMVARADGAWRRLLDTSVDQRGVHGSRSGWSLLTAVTQVPPSCTDPPFTACGGDVEGTWTLDSSCIQVSDLFLSYGGSDPYASCEPGEAIVSEYPFREGTLTFSGDGAPSEGEEGASSYSDQGTERVLQVDTLTHACAATTGLQCDPQYCVEDAATCTCTWETHVAASVGGGYWSYVDDTTLRRDNSTTPYCVEGDRLTLELGEGRYATFTR